MTKSPIKALALAGVLALVIPAGLAAQTAAPADVFALHVVTNPSANAAGGDQVIATYDKENLLDGAAVKVASVINDVIGQPALLIEFTPAGAAQFEAAVAKAADRPVIVMIGGKSAAPPASLTRGVSGQIIVREVGDQAQAEALAAALNKISASSPPR